MDIRFWAPSARKINVNKTPLPAEYRDRSKGELVDSFQEAGFTDDTWVLLIDRKGANMVASSEPKRFSDIPTNAVYRGRANRISGNRPRGILHTFEVK